MEVDLPGTVIPCSEVRGGYHMFTHGVTVGMLDWWLKRNAKKM